MKEQHLLGCAIQAWTLQGLGLPIAHVVVAHVNNQVYQGDSRYEGLLAEEDVTEPIKGARRDGADARVERARSLLASSKEPRIAVGSHCGAPFDCPFYEHCAPSQGKYSVWALGGRKEHPFDLMHAGYEDLRDVPEDRLRNDQQRRIWEQTKLEAPFIGAGLREFVEELGYPPCYLDFETISFAVPIWPKTRPYEALPFQWSCHIDDGRHELAHEAFLDVSGSAPMRASAERLIETLGTEGPILVYTPFENGVLVRLGKRYLNLRKQLEAIRERLVDLHPVTKAHYYHPDMLGSWSIKNVLPTVAPELRYDTLGEVQDGNAAQTAYLEAVHPETSAERREKLRRDMLEYCRHDTLAMVKLVEFFSTRAHPSL